MKSQTIAKEHPSSAGKQGSNYRFALVSLTSLFFMWGFITALNDVLIPYLKGMFELGFAQAMLVQFCFFGAYFIVSVPAGILVKRLGYQRNRHWISRGKFRMSVIFSCGFTKALLDFSHRIICFGFWNNHPTSRSQPIRKYSWESKNGILAA